MGYDRQDPQKAFESYAERAEQWKEGRLEDARVSAKDYASLKSFHEVSHLSDVFVS